MRKCRVQGRSPDDDDDGHEQPAGDRALEEQQEERGAEEEEAAGPSLIFNQYLRPKKVFNQDLRPKKFSNNICDQAKLCVNRRRGLETKMWKELCLKKNSVFALRVAVRSEKNQMECN